MIVKKAKTTKKPEDLIRDASPGAIMQSLESAAKRFRRWQRWLNKNHHYNRDVIEVIRSRNNSAKALGEYIACSVPLHLLDGWDYLSRSFNSACHGDRFSAFHLAYYAELRAAMSLLAADGIGVFSNRHVAIGEELVLLEYKGHGTHHDAWKLLRAWSQRQGNGKRLLDLISVDSASLSDWLAKAGIEPEAGQQALANVWLREWSLDLSAMARDRSRRNKMSYRPTRIETPAPSPVQPHQEMSEPLVAAWTVLEPWSGGGVALDVALLRKALHYAASRGLGSSPNKEAALRALRDHGNLTEPLYEIMARDALPGSEHSPIAYAEAIFETAGMEHGSAVPVAVPILYRALLMLRIASARAAKLLSEADVSRSDLEFWWAPLGTDLGLWEAPGDVESFADLWADVEDALADEKIRSVPDRPDASPRLVSGILAPHVALTQFSRAGLWLLDLK